MLAAFLLLQAYAAAGCTTGNGDVPFTKSLYDKGESEYRKATCIADYEFCQQSVGAAHSLGPACKYTGSGDINITGLPLLKSIGIHAFYGATGTVAFGGEFPRLEIIGEKAFSYVAGSPSQVAFQTGLPLLKSIDTNAFFHFKGIVLFAGDFPRLETIGKNAFYGDTSSSSQINFQTGLPLLKSIGISAFHLYKGTVVFSGDCPRLESIGRNAFTEALSSSSRFVFQTGLPLLNSVGSAAFWKFSGTVVLRGDFPRLETINLEAFDRVAGPSSQIAFLKGLPLLKTIGFRAFYAFKGTVEFSGDFPRLESIARTSFEGASRASIQLCSTKSNPQIKVCHYNKCVINVCPKASATPITSTIKPTNNPVSTPTVEATINPESTPTVEGLNIKLKVSFNGLVDLAAMTQGEKDEFAAKLTIALLAASPGLTAAEIEAIVLQAVDRRSRARRAGELVVDLQLPATMNQTRAAAIVADINKAIANGAFTVAPFQVGGKTITLTAAEPAVLESTATTVTTTTTTKTTTTVTRTTTITTITDTTTVATSTATTMTTATTTTVTATTTTTAKSTTTVTRTTPTTTVTVTTTNGQSDTGYVTGQQDTPAPSTKTHPATPTLSTGCDLKCQLAKSKKDAADANAKVAALDKFNKEHATAARAKKLEEDMATEQSSDDNDDSDDNDITTAIIIANVVVVLLVVIGVVVWQSHGAAPKHPNDNRINFENPLYDQQGSGPMDNGSLRFT